MTGNRSITVVALGGNLPSKAGDPARTLGAAIAAMPGQGLVIRAVSRFFATPCFPAGAGPDYVNATVCVETGLPPEAVLLALHRIEARFGRRRQQRWGTRTLDLDLICVANLVLPDPATLGSWINLAADRQGVSAPDRLILPHPRLQDRAFVLVPMADIAPGWRHPVLGRTVAQMRDALPGAEIDAVRPL